jgi:hypothetical protein
LFSFFRILGVHLGEVIFVSLSIPLLSFLKLFLQQDNKENWAINNFEQETCPSWEEKDYLLIVWSEPSEFTIVAANITTGSMNNSFWGLSYVHDSFSLLLCSGVGDNQYKEKKSEWTSWWQYLPLAVLGLIFCTF